MSFIGKASPSKLLQAATKGKAPAVKKCIKAGVTVDCLGKNSNTPLHFACQGGHNKAVEALLNAGADFALLNDAGASALHLAATGNHRYVVSLLLDRIHTTSSADALINALDNEDHTPLYCAVTARAEKATTLLVMRGADCDLEYDGKKIMDIASAAMKNVLKEAFVDRDAAGKKDVEKMNQLLTDGQCDKLVIMLEQNRSQVDNRNAEGHSLLYLALCQYKIDIVMALLKLGASVDAVDKYGNTALHWAALEGQDEVGEILLKREATISARNHQGMTPLLVAAQWGRVSFLRLLLQHGADPMEITREGETVLHVACRYRRVKAVSAILGTRKGEGLLHKDVAFRLVEVVDNRLRSALHHAAECLRLDLLQLLVSFLFKANSGSIGSLLNMQDASGMTALHYATKSNRKEIIELLLDAGSSGMITCASGKTALHTACSWPKPQDIGRDRGVEIQLEAAKKKKKKKLPVHSRAIQGHGECVRLLAESFPASLSVVDDAGRSPLHYAVEAGHYELCGFLASKGGDIHLKDKKKKSPLSLCLGLLDPTAAKEAIEAGRKEFDDAQDNLSKAIETALVAIQKGDVTELAKQVDVIDNKKEKGEEVAVKATETAGVKTPRTRKIHSVLKELTDNEGHSCLHVAFMSTSSAAMEEFLLCHLPEALHIASPVSLSTPLHLAVKNREWERILPLLDAGARVDLLDSSSKTPLDLASESVRDQLMDHLQVKAEGEILGCIREVDINGVQRCLKLGARADSQDEYLCTPMHLAAEFGNTAIFSLLLDSLDLDRVHWDDEAMQTPMHVAAQQGKKEIVRLLLKKKVGTGQPDIMEKTPLHLAVEKEHLSIIKQLLRAGADAHEKNAEGKSPYDVASQVIKDDIDAVMEDIAAKKLSDEKLSIALEKGDLEQVLALLIKGAQMSIAEVFLAGMDDGSEKDALEKLIIAHTTQIAVSHPKETNFYGRQYAWEVGLAGYGEFFAQKRVHSSRRPIHLMESSPGYITSSFGRERLWGFAPDARLVTSFRDPVERALSQYYYNMAKTSLPAETYTATFEMQLYEDFMWLKECFDDVLPEAYKDNPPPLYGREPSTGAQRVFRTRGNTCEQIYGRREKDKYFGSSGFSGILAKGFYVRHLKYWFEVVPPENMMIVRFEDLHERGEAAVLNEIAWFVGLDELSPYEWREITAKANHNAVKHPDMEPETREWLTGFYHESNKELYAYIDRDMGWSEPQSLISTVDEEQDLPI